MKHGDWICVVDKCRNVNFASRTQCRACGTANPNQSNDWICTCGEKNFASRSQCRKCNAVHNSSNPSTVAKPGDWHCTCCKDLNFASRTTCRKCNTPKSQQTNWSKPGDWKCDKCNDMNFGSRVVCRNCGEKRDKVPTTSSTNSEDSSECVICMENPANVVISTCGHLGLCMSCGSKISKCPVCRQPFTPDNLLKVFKV